MAEHKSKDNNETAENISNDEQKDKDESSKQSNQSTSKCTNDPSFPIISIEQAQKEYKSASDLIKKYKFLCITYRKYKQGIVKESDFPKLNEIMQYVYDQMQIQNKSKKPELSKTNEQICTICNKSFDMIHCKTTCSHPLCVRCLILNVFNHPPNNANIRFYTCPKKDCNQMLPPNAHYIVLTYKPKKEDKNTQKYDRMMKEFTKARNVCFKNMLKIIGEYFFNKLRACNRWRQCEECDFGFLADSKIAWFQVFELQCGVCLTVQRVQLFGPPPINRLSLKCHYIPANKERILKTLVFIRHGEAENNVRCNDPNLRDPELTNRGKEQCKELNAFIGSLIRVDCILTSSMNRCVQTAVIGLRANNEKIPFVALECLRERLFPKFNRREKISVKKEKYKKFGIDFSECKCDNDEYFDEERKNESYEQMNQRAWQFYVYLMKREEKCVAVVSHEGMLQCLMNIIAVNDKSLKKSFKNAEARMCYLNEKM